MSFWPFGQSLNNSNINKILDDYFNILHNVESTAANVTNTSTSSSSGTILDQDEEDKSHINTHTSKDNLAFISNEQGTKYREQGNHIKPTLSNGQQKEDTQSIKPIGIGTGNSIISNSNQNSVGSNTSTSIQKQTHNNAANASLKLLNSSFMDKILDEPELLNELTRKNNTLLDFICFGYYYDEDKKKVQNIEYLINLLMFCIDRINENQDIINDKHNEETGKKEEENGSKKKRKGNTEEERKEGKKDNDDTGDDEKEEEEEKEGKKEEEQEEEDTYLHKATVISEIFALDIWLISESLVKSAQYLANIWSILSNPLFKKEKSPLVPIFLKINTNLLITRQDQYLNFIRSDKVSLVDDMLKHIDVPVLMDFFLKIISTDKQESPTGILELLQDQNIIDKLITFFDNEKYSKDIQTCSCDFLKALIAISANASLDDLTIGPNVLTRHLCSSPRILDSLIDIIAIKRGFALNNAVSIVIELIRKNNSDYDQINLLNTTIKNNPPSSRDPIYLGYMLKRFTQELPTILEIVLQSDKSTESSTRINQMGESYEPLGFERFKVVELIAELLHCSNMGLMNSRRAELIALKRDKVRENMLKQLEDAFEELTLKNNDTTNTDTNSSDEPDLDDEEIEINQIAEIDESFDIPYVNINQNSKIRENPTIGDYFKITLFDLQILPRIVSMFLKFPWNNFWHNVIFDIIQQVFNGRMDYSYNSFLVFSLFESDQFSTFCAEKSAVGNFLKFDLPRDLILEGYKQSCEFFNKTHMNLGFMGHLVLIAEEIVKFSKVYKVELISPAIHESLSNPNWVFYSEDILMDTRLMYSKILGGEMSTNAAMDEELLIQQQQLQQQQQQQLQQQHGDNSVNYESLDEFTEEQLIEEGLHHMDEEAKQNQQGGNTAEGNMDGENVYDDELVPYDGINPPALLVPTTEMDIINYTTQEDLNSKLRKRLIEQSRLEVEKKNADKGVILLGYTESSAVSPTSTFNGNDDDNKNANANENNFMHDNDNNQVK
ncbi:SAPS family protein SCDLUD_002284 [Saccharomycodes ludwigii]|uniref:SAPS family protein n=1 Tax=Saccharomycodes ludwigii TaxID=36035 RepID=UPI001E897F89|nr:hypothetical protein SCDLUD_002284 [Saccharomycodes ludwigii]KAH3900831.1 hypothetical protein SCDLUD_002284 [Saccharomycodes ludwigii]